MTVHHDLKTSRIEQTPLVQSTTTEATFSGSIAIYYSFHALFGTEIVLQRLAAEFARRGCKVWLLADGEQCCLMPNFPAVVEVVSLNTPRTSKAVWPLVKFLRENRPDVALSAYPLNNIALVTARWLARTRTSVILTEHVPMDPRFNGYPTMLRHTLRFLLPRAYRRADAVVAVSEGVRDRLRWIGLRDGRLRVGVNPAYADHTEKPGEVHSWFRDQSIPVVLGVGRLHPDKDFSTLMRAFAQVRQKRPLRLVIAGEGPSRDELKALAAELGISDEVLMTGYHANPRSLMERCGAFVLCSLREGSPLALLEALASGCPVIATATTGASDMLENGRHGSIVPIGDVDALADAIESALSRPHDPEPGLKHAARFSVTESANFYQEVFSDVRQRGA